MQNNVEEDKVKEGNKDQQNPQAPHQNNGSSVVSRSSNSGDVKKNNFDTYIRVEEGEGAESLEFDLIYVRERGRASQFLEVKFSYNDQYGQLQEVRKLIESKEQFDKIKNFFVNLDWGSAS